MAERIVRVGVLGAGAWARSAHLPGYRRDPRCQVVGIADIVITLYRGRVVARYQGDDITMASILADITHITHPIQSVA